jgi:hypothetical protein
MNDITVRDLLTLFVLALPTAAISWTVTHEDLFREVHDSCIARSHTSRSLAARKFFYLLTCEYCFSHYVAAGILFLSGFRLLFSDWRGYRRRFAPSDSQPSHQRNGRLRRHQERATGNRFEAESEQAGVQRKAS